MEEPKPKKKICCNCKHGGDQFKLGSMTHLHCLHENNPINDPLPNNPRSQYDTLREFGNTCELFESKH